VRHIFPKFGRDNFSNRIEWIRRTLSCLPDNVRLLDVGAGELRNRSFCAHVDYVSQDFCQYQGQGNGLALQSGLWDTSKIDIISDITAIPAPDASFDVVLCTEVLEHVPDPLAAMREMCRLLKPGGHLILTVPFCSLTHFAPFHFSTGFSTYWFERHLSELGFNIVEVTPNGGWLDYVAQELWRLPWIGTTYSYRLLGWLALILALPTLVLMRVMKVFDSGSSELLTFGWHVLAHKNQASL
jgi:SAM-dependent methyltransferase